MQSQTAVQATTWVTFAIETVKILGPATLALAGSWIALRYQRKLKEVEINAQITLKARELVFEAYQRELDTKTTELKDLAKALKTFSMALQGGTQDEQKQAALEVGKRLPSMVVPLLSDIDRLEQELKNLGLLDRYLSQLAYVKETMGEPIVVTDLVSAKNNCEKQFLVVNHLTAMFQDILEKKRQALFSDYLPQ
jgi:hypothetical protein